MALETDTDVTELRQVQDEQGNAVPPSGRDVQKDIRDQAGNFAGVAGFQYNTGGTDAEQLQSASVPEGVPVLIWALPGNSGRVNVGGPGGQPIPLPPDGTISLRVDNTDALYIQTPTAGDGVGVLFEDG